VVHQLRRPLLRALPVQSSLRVSALSLTTFRSWARCTRRGQT
jgi:hypothetical protein